MRYLPNGKIWQHSPKCGVQCAPASSWHRRSAWTDERWLLRAKHSAYVLMNNQRRKLIERWGTRSFWRCIGAHMSISGRRQIFTWFWWMQKLGLVHARGRKRNAVRLRFAHSPNSSYYILSVLELIVFDFSHIWGNKCIKCISSYFTLVRAHKSSRRHHSGRVWEKLCRWCCRASPTSMAYFILPMEDELPDNGERFVGKINLFPRTAQWLESAH
jgi:hypothetical protein